MNQNGLTALDMIEQMPKDVKSKDIREFLISAGALRAQEIQSATATSLLNPAVDDKTKQLTVTGQPPVIASW